MTEDEYYDLQPGERFIWEDIQGRKGVYEVLPDGYYVAGLIARRVSGDGLGRIVPRIAECAWMEKLPPERSGSETD